MLCAMVVWMIAVEDGPNDVSSLGVLLGALIVILGFEGARWRNGK